jgi:hypothetical protein
MILVPGGAMGAMLYSYCPSKFVAADIFGFILEVRNMLSVRMACGRILSHKCMGKALSVEHNPAIKRSLNEQIARLLCFDGSTGVLAKSLCLGHVNSP